MTFWSPNELLFGLGYGSKFFSGSTHVVEKFSFAIIASVLTFEFYLILGLFFTFWSPNGLLLGLGYGSKSFLGSNHVVEQLLFSILPILYSQNLFLKILQIF